MWISPITIGYHHYSTHSFGIYLVAFAGLFDAAATLLTVADKLDLPYTPCWPKEVKDASPRAQRLRIVTANVLQSNRQYQPLLNLVREYNPDILVTLESDQHWQAQLDSLADILPYRVICPQSNLYGMHVYSRFKLQHTAIEYIIEEDIPSIHSNISLPNGVAIDFHFLHPAPPSPTENESAEPRDAELVVVAKRVAKHQRPTIITGDLNDVAWSPTTRLFRKISGLLDPRVGRGMFNTFHTICLCSLAFGPFVL